MLRRPLRAGLLGLLALAACDDGGDAPGVGPGLFPDTGADRGPLPTVDRGFPDAADRDAAPRPPDAGPPADARVLPDTDPPEPDGAPIDAGPPPPFEDPAWPVRTCEIDVAWTGDAADVRLAGDFTGWQAGALPLARGGDGVFRRSVGPGDGLVPGQVHAYKLIVDGRWIIDPGARLRKYDGNCVNGGLRAPACDQGPLLRGHPVEARPDGVFTATIQALRAADETPLDAVQLRLDGAPLAATVEPATGTFTARGAGLAPGRHVIEARATDARGRAADPVDLVFWIEDAPHDWRDGALYLLFLDRFANGEPANDAPVGPPVTYPADWHGGDLQGALAVLESGYFERLGVGTIWLSPVNTQVEGHFAERGGGDRRIAPYHGYWPVRGRQVDPRLGGDDALRAFVEAAHARG
ncbi:MAG: alpha-amylase family glycosyl hydrolase, partial [bacterium]